jgi:hypothetical protein
MNEPALLPTNSCLLTIVFQGARRDLGGQADLGGQYLHRHLCAFVQCFSVDKFLEMGFLSKGF